MRRLRDRLALVFGGLMLCVMASIILGEEKALSRLVEELETQRFESAAVQFVARLEGLLQAHAGRLEELDRTDDFEVLARTSGARAAAEALALTERIQAERMVLAEPGGVVLAARPDDAVARELAALAPPAGGTRKELVLLPEGLHLLCARTFVHEGHPSQVLILADHVGPEILRRAADGEDDLVAVAAEGRVLELYSPPGESTQGPRVLSAELARRLQGAPPSDDPWPLRLGVEDFLLVGQPLRDPGSGRVVARLWFGRRAAEVYGPVEGQRRRLLAIGLAGLLGALAGALLLSGRITRPIEYLARRMRRVAEGELETVSVQGRDEVAQLASSFNDMTQGLRQRELLRRYVPVQARQLIDADTEGRVVLGGQRTQVTVLFSDLRGFTALSEALDAAEVVALLNEYLDAMIRVLHSLGGDVSDYLGDAILAIFHDGEEPSTLRAVQAALRMQQELELLRARSANPHMRDLRMGIGIHTGEVVEGNIGTAERLKYAVVGDTVNVGARVQDRSRDGRHTCILISEAARQVVADRIELSFFGEERLKGKTALVTLWEVLREKPSEPAAPPPQEVGLA